MPYCSVCDRKLEPDERECPDCGAPSTSVMGRLDGRDDEWERLADDYVPAGRAPWRPAAAADPDGDPDGDLEWRSLVERVGPVSGRPHVRSRLRGWWRRLRGGGAP